MQNKHFILFLCNGSIKRWCQLTHYHRRAAALQVRQCGNIQFTICIHCANRQPHCNKEQLYRYVQACRMIITSSVSVLCLWTLTLQNVDCDNNLPVILKCYQIYDRNCLTIVNFGVADMTLQCLCAVFVGGLIVIVASVGTRDIDAIKHTRAHCAIWS